MKILFVSQHYRPEPCDSRTSQLAALMAARGHMCTALTTFPNYPFGRIYEGYEQSFVERELRHGVSVVRVPMIPDHSKSKTKRAMSYLSFLTSCVTFGLFATPRPDVVWIHHPPLTTGLAGWFLAKVKRAPFVLEIHDLWPETLVSTRVVPPGKATRLIERTCKFLYKRAARIIVTSPGMKDNLVSKGVLEDKVEVIYQWADEDIYRPTMRDSYVGQRYALVGKSVFMFAGNQGLAQGLDSILDAAKLLEHRKEIQFVLVGNGVETGRLLERAAKENIGNVSFIPHQSHKQMPKLLAWADALIIQLKDDPLFAITVPSKTQAYMASARPILCGVSGDTAQLIADADCGLTYKPESAESLVATVTSFLDLSIESRLQMAKNGREYYQSHFSQAALATRYVRLFASVCAPHLQIEESGEKENLRHAA